MAQIPGRGLEAARATRKQPNSRPPRLASNPRAQRVELHAPARRPYLELLQRGEIAGASVATEKKEDTKEEEEDKVLVDLRAVVKGLGPFFHLEVEVANLGDESLLQIPILLSYNPEKYKSPKPLIQIGALVPGIPLKCIFELECLDVNAVDEEVEIQVLPSQLEDVLRETDRLESDVNFSALVMSRVTMPQSSML